MNVVSNWLNIYWLIIYKSICACMGSRRDKSCLKVILLQINIALCWFGPLPAEEKDFSQHLFMTELMNDWGNKKIMKWKVLISQHKTIILYIIDSDIIPWEPVMIVLLFVEIIICLTNLDS